MLFKKRGLKVILNFLLKLKKKKKSYLKKVHIPDQQGRCSILLF